MSRARSVRRAPAQRGGNASNANANGGKPQLTPGTLASHAADNNQKTQKEQTTSKAWYHWFW
jgi:hypothetical protein